MKYWEKKTTNDIKKVKKKKKRSDKKLKEAKMEQYLYCQTLKEQQKQ